MKKRVYLKNIGLIIFVLLQCTLVNAAETPLTVRVGWFEMPGYQYESDEGEKTGYSYDYYQAIGKHANLAFEFVPGTWNECLERLEKGEIDMLSFVEYTRERDEFLDFTTGSMGHSYACLSTLKTNKEIVENSPKTFDGKRVGVVKGSTRINYLRDYEARYNFNSEIVVYDSLEMMTTALEQGDVDMILNNSMWKSPENEQEVARFSPRRFFIAVPQGNTVLMNRIENAMDELELHDENIQTRLKDQYYVTGVQGVLRRFYDNPQMAGILLLSIFGIIILLLLVTLHEKIKYGKSLVTIMETDSVTGYPNYRKLKKDLATTFHPKPGESYVLIYSNVQNFKYINDIYGHAFGDCMLTCMHRIICEHLEKNEYGTRMNSDRFIQIKKYDSYEALIRQLDWLNVCLWEALEAEKVTYHPVLRAGIYRLPEGEIDLEKAIDLAIYAQRSAENSVETTRVFYSESMEKQLMKERSLEQDMAKGIAEHEFEAFYQAKVDAETGKIVGAEALVRWHHPEKGYLSPGDFIPFFEKNGFIVRLDFYMFERVCAELRQMIDAGQTPVPISCNFSRNHFKKWEVTTRCDAIVARYGIPKKLLEIEITEEGAICEIKNVIDYIYAIKAAGYALAIDDFGSGVTSVQLLYDLPIDILKLDKSILERHHNDGIKDDILKSIIAIADKNQIQVISEGVETKEQLEAVRRVGIRYIQGFYFAKPEPFEAFCKRLAETN